MNFLIDNTVQVTLSELIENNEFSSIVIRDLSDMKINDSYHIGTCTIRRIKPSVFNVGDKVKINVPGSPSHNKAGCIFSISGSGKYDVSYKKIHNNELLDFFYLRSKSSPNILFKAEELIKA